MMAQCNPHTILADLVHRRISFRFTISFYRRTICCNLNLTTFRKLLSIFICNLVYKKLSSYRVNPPSSSEQFLVHRHGVLTRLATPGDQKLQARTIRYCYYQSIPEPNSPKSCQKDVLHDPGITNVILFGKVGLSINRVMVHGRTPSKKRSALAPCREVDLFPMALALQVLLEGHRRRQSYSISGNPTAFCRKPAVVLFITGPAIRHWI